MADLPSGTVTFAFSDIEGSTGHLKRLGERYGDLIAEHRRLMRGAYGACDGVEIDAQGDSFFFAFVRARDAVAAAVAAQRAHAEHTWVDGETPRVRMGLHTGEPSVGEEGYVGLDVVRAARLCTAGRGGHVLLSEPTRALVGSTLPGGVTVDSVGVLQLKDIDEPERVYSLAIDGVEQPAGELSAADSAPDWERRADELEKLMADKINRYVAGQLESALGDLGKRR
jgi:class 3 adenylate cyclase